MGSVKDLSVIREPDAQNVGLGDFNFSNRYSVFDWGEMPNHLENKGAALCAMSAHFFQKAEASGVPVHYLGVVQNGECIPLEYLSKPSNKMRIQLVRVIKPTYDPQRGYDYSNLTGIGNFVVPLEVIYRNSLPKGSSVFRRLKEGSLTLEELGLTGMPAEGFRFEEPFVDASTKYEEFDRYPGWKELQELSGLSDSDLFELKRYTLIANGVITEGMKAAGFVNEDGKLEFAYDPEGRLMIVDTLGTLDECRFTYNGVDASKQIPRDWYKFSQPRWVTEIEEAKRRDKKNWKSLVETKPKPLPPPLREILENLYPAVANAVIGRQLFSGIPNVGEVVREYETFKDTEMN